MNKILEDATKQWKEGSSRYSDVKAISVTDASDVRFSEKCLEGCELIVHETDKSYETDSWRATDSGDLYRITLKCQNHGYARIYFIEGIDLTVK